MEQATKKALRGRPPKRTRAEVLLERKFCADFDARFGASTNRRAIHFFGWVARSLERAKDPDALRERLLRDFVAAVPVGDRTWRSAVEWYCTGKAPIGGGEK